MRQEKIACCRAMGKQGDSCRNDRGEWEATVYMHEGSVGKREKQCR